MTALDGLKDCDVIVEAIIEQLPAKRELFVRLPYLPGTHDLCQQHLIVDDQLKIAAVNRNGRSGLSDCIFLIRCRS